MMKILWHLLPLLVTGLTIVASSSEESDLPEDEVQKVLALYNRHCKSSYGLSTSPGHNVHIVCKEGREDYGPPKKQIIKIPSTPQKKSILFVEAPTYKVKHDITLVGNGGGNPKTSIYILPNRNNHNFNFQYKNHGVQNVPKPEVFFLGNNKGSTPSAPSEGYPISGPSGGYPSGSVSGGYQSPSPNPSIGYSHSTMTSYQQPQSASQELQQPMSFPGLGPQYEVVSADPDTINKYEQYFNLIQQGYQGHGGALGSQIIQNTSPQQQRLDTRVIFPSESMQQYQFTNTEPSVSRPTTTTTKGPELTTHKTVSSLLPRNLFKRKLSSTFSSKVLFPEEKTIEDFKQNIAYNDYYNYMQSQSSGEDSKETNSTESNENKEKSNSKEKVPKDNKSKEKSAEIKYKLSPVQSKSSAIPDLKKKVSHTTSFHSRLLLALAAKAQTERSEENYSQQASGRMQPSSSGESQSYTYFEDSNNPQSSSFNINRNKKRSDSQSFEMFPANFISYSYTKSNTR